MSYGGNREGGRGGDRGWGERPRRERPRFGDEAVAAVVGEEE